MKRGAMKNVIVRITAAAASTVMRSMRQAPILLTSWNPRCMTRANVKTLADSVRYARKLTGHFIRKLHDACRCAFAEDPARATRTVRTESNSRYASGRGTGAQAYLEGPELLLSLAAVVTVLGVGLVVIRSLIARHRRARRLSDVVQRSRRGRPPRPPSRLLRGSWCRRRFDQLGRV